MIEFFKCECGFDGFDSEPRAVAFYNGHYNRPDQEVVKCPVGTGWHVIDITKRSRDEFCRWVVAGGPLKSQRKVVTEFSHPGPQRVLTLEPQAKKRCTKIGYGNQVLAQMVLTQAQANGRAERQTYQCTDCNRWHMSSIDGDVTGPIETTELLSLQQSEHEIVVLVGNYPGGSTAFVKVEDRHTGAGVLVHVKNLHALKSCLDFVMSGIQKQLHADAFRDLDHS